MATMPSIWPASFEWPGESLISSLLNGIVAAALNLIEQYRFHAALLDANLSGRPVDDIADLLARKNVPFAFVSGYDRQALPGAFAKAELLSKPFKANQLMDVAARLTA